MHWLLVATTLLASTLACSRQAIYEYHVIDDYLEPVALRSNPSASALPNDLERGDMRLRVLVSATYRRENQGWAQRVRRTIEGASAFLRGQFGVGLDIVQIVKWDRDDTADDSLDSSLSALRAVEPGRDCDLVVGFVGAETFPYHFDFHGLAEMPGRYLVIRGSVSIDLLKWQSRTLRNLRPDEHDRLNAAIKAHLDIVGFVHTWAHAIGAPHDIELDYVLSEVYRPRTNMLSVATIDILRSGLTVWRATTVDRRKAAKTAMLEALATHCAVLEPETRTAIERALQGDLDLPPVSAGHGEVLDPVEAAELAATSERLDHGDYAEAAVRIERLAAAHPNHPQIQAESCRVRAQTEPTIRETAETCVRACTLDRGIGACARAVHVLHKAERLSDLPDAVAVLQLRVKEQHDAAEQLLAAQVLAEAGWLAVAETVLAGLGLMPQSVQLQAEITKRRRWTGLPPGAVPPDREADYLDVWARSAAKDRDRDYTLREESEPFQGVPGLVVLAAEHEAEGGHWSEAREGCSQAVAKYPACLGGHYLLGRIELAEHHTAEAAVHLRMVVEADPHFEPAWHSLAQALIGAKQEAQLIDLKQLFRKEFGRPLPTPK